MREKIEVHQHQHTGDSLAAGGDVTRPPTSNGGPSWRQWLPLALGLGGGLGGGAASARIAQQQPAPVILRVEFDQLQRANDLNAQRIKLLEDQRHDEREDTIRWRANVDAKMTALDEKLDELLKPHRR